MAKIMIVGDASVIVSALKFEDIQMVEKYRPGKLVLMGGKDNDEPQFAINTGRTGSVSEYGITFNNKDDAGYAIVTQVIVGNPDDRKAFIADTIGASIVNLNKLEEEIPAVITEIRAEKEAVLASIEVVGATGAENTQSV